MIGTAAAFVRRDSLSWMSYRMAAVWQILGLFGLIALIYLVGRTVGGNAAGVLAPYGTDFTAFLLAGLAFTDVWQSGFFLARGLREHQSRGTLEAMMLSHFGVFPLLLYSAVFPLLLSLSRLVVYTLVAVFGLGIWHSANVPAVLAIFLAAFAALGCLGTLSVAFVLVLKQGDPVLAAYGLLSTLLGGVFFPREVLPSWLQPLSLAFPLTYALEGMRRALRGESLADIAPEVSILLAMFMVLLPVTIWALRWAIRRAKEEGSLVQY